jgi:ADP-ribose pyrophosphatase
MADDKWETIDRSLVYDGEPFLKVWLEKVRLPDGRIIEDYHQIWIPDAVIILMTDTEGRLLAYDEYRHGLRGNTLSFPAGRLQPDEDPLEAARRELREETGYAAPDWSLVAQYLPSGSYRMNTTYIAGATGGHRVGSPTETDYENPQTRWMVAEDVRHALETGGFKVMSYACAALHWLEHVGKD